ncbi:MAG: hypothetical protein KDA20_01895 [Phycisphaerales bacterium]|nr:hypothetical protein [Phycisphaerales bacterium]
MAGAIGAGATVGARDASAAALKVHVDARDIAKRLITSTVRLEPVESGPLDFWYPKFIPGNHCASGPIHNVGGFFVRDDAGRALAWERDPTEPRRITVDVPSGAAAIDIETTYITNQPSSVSRSSDSYGFPTFGAVNWNTVLWYPGETDLGNMRVDATIVVPDGWRGAGAGFAQSGAELVRRSVPFMELVDTPVVFGQYFETHELDAPHGRGHLVHSVGHDALRSAMPAWTLSRMNAMLTEAEIIFGPFRREDYHFFILADNALRFGLEHGRSTFTSAGADELLDAAEEPEEGALEAGMGGMTVLPHEYIHAWNGKLASPAGILRTNYHEALDGSLLWVYEGLTTYYTDVLAVRAGMISPAEFEHRLTNSIDRYSRQEGRRWRSIEDTARDVEHVRVPSPNWEDLRRRADYYGDGALFWLECDAIIRRGTNGGRSLDDFCRAFYDVPVLPVGRNHGYTRDDIVRTLAEVWDGEDWDVLIRVRVEAPVESLGYDRMLRELGRELVHTKERSALQRRADRRDNGLDLRATLGLTVNREGEIGSVGLGSPADKVGLRAGMRIIAVNDVMYSSSAMREQLKGEPDVLRLLVGERDQVHTLTIDRPGGLVFPHLRRIKGEPDIMQAIIAPRRPGAGH